MVSNKNDVKNETHILNQPEEKIFEEKKINTLSNTIKLG